MLFCSGKCQLRLIKGRLKDFRERHFLSADRHLRIERSFKSEPRRWLCESQQPRPGSELD